MNSCLAVEDRQKLRRESPAESSTRKYADWRSYTGPPGGEKWGKGGTLPILIPWN
jgi:hypothetical protein